MHHDALSLPESEQLCGSVAEASQVSELRRAAVGIAGRLGFDETAAARAAIVVTEVASNLVKHARAGEILLRPVHSGEKGAGLEVLSLDSGPGIADVGRALRDGYSTAGSSGSGLGAIQRLASEFDLYSTAGSGTALLARLWSSCPASLEQGAALSVGAVRVARRYEPVCGDDWAYRDLPLQGHTFVVADGLGHGENAALAAREAVSVLQASPSCSPCVLIDTMHGRLRSTRGAAVMVVQVDSARGRIRHAGIGNISAVVFDGSKVRHLVSQNGIVGHDTRRIREQETACPDSWMLVMHSDGVTGRWDLEHYPGLPARDPSVIAGVLYRDHKRDRDDACVLVAKGRRQ